MRIACKRPAVRMIRCHGYAPRVVDQQKNLQSYDPLQRVHITLLAIFEWHDPASCVAFNIADNPLFWIPERRILELHHGVAGSGDGLPEDDLSNINRYV